jgi:hypothetical protein
MPVPAKAIPPDLIEAMVGMYIRVSLAASAECSGKGQAYENTPAWGLPTSFDSVPSPKTNPRTEAPTVTLF